MIACRDGEVQISVQDKDVVSEMADVLTETTIILRSVGKWLSEYGGVSEANKMDYLIEALALSVMTPDELSDELERCIKERDGYV